MRYLDLSSCEELKNIKSSVAVLVSVVIKMSERSSAPGEGGGNPG